MEVRLFEEVNWTGGVESKNSILAERGLAVQRLEYPGLRVRIPFADSTGFCTADASRMGFVACEPTAG